MGVLEDAIREHLELKRQHGASEQELNNQEEEALGPARRDVAGAGESVAEGEEPAAFPAEGAEAEAVDLAEPAEAIEPVEAVEPVDPVEEAAAQPFDQGVPAEVAPEEVPFEEPPPEAAEPVPAEAEPPLDEPAPPPAESAPPLDEPAPAPAEPEDVRFDEEEPGAAPPMPSPPLDEPEQAAPSEPEAAAPAEGDEDVLEETPEFLQETPEHDRLWFEQKPPRDFDFD